MESIRGCDTWLKLQLQDMELRLCDDLRKKARERGFTKQELKKTREVIGVKTFHQFDEKGATENWFWYIEV